MRRGVAAAALGLLAAGCGVAPQAAVGVPLRSTLDGVGGVGLRVAFRTADAGSTATSPAATPTVPAPAPGATDSVFTTTLTFDRDGEGRLTLHARGIGTDWASAGRESAVLSLYLDGRHNQEVILYRGSDLQDYSVLLGPVSAGKHTLEARFRADLSSPQAGGAEVASATYDEVTPGDPMYEIVARSPIVYALPDVFHSDVPFVHGWERTAHGIKYTNYQTNEDGGTPTADLFAEYGRGADIDYDYEYDSTTGTGKYQGLLDQGFTFNGRYEGLHPFLRDFTANHDWTPDGTSDYELRLPLLQMPQGSRECMLDQLPWTYRLTAVELEREGKIRHDSRPAAGQIGSDGFWLGDHPEDLGAWLTGLVGNQVADPRNYLYVDYDHPNNSVALAFKAQLSTGPAWFSSTGGFWNRAISDPGHVRTAIELPAGADPRSVSALVPIASDGTWYQGNVPVNKVFYLDSNYQPVDLPVPGR